MQKSDILDSQNKMCERCKLPAEAGQNLAEVEHAGEWPCPRQHVIQGYDCLYLGLRKIKLEMTGFAKNQLSFLLR